MTKIIIVAVMIAIFCIAYGIVLYVDKGMGDETFYAIVFFIGILILIALEVVLIVKLSANTR